MFVYMWNILHENVGHHNIYLSRFYCALLKSWQAIPFANHLSSSTIDRLERCDKKLISVQLGLFFETFTDKMDVLYVKQMIVLDNTSVRWIAKKQYELTQEFLFYIMSGYGGKKSNVFGTVRQCHI